MIYFGNHWFFFIQYKEKYTTTFISTGAVIASNFALHYEISKSCPLFASNSRKKKPSCYAATWSIYLNLDIRFAF